ncbi:MAG TPA: TfuA-like protein, partial [Methanocorpusculum sp.]|nr:TfuA-like protein [Methanocorpusculum sp.]
MPKTVVYLGPSFPLEEAKTYLPDAVFRPPVKRGDVAAAAAEGMEVMVIIDGVFFQNEAVAHKEILAALKAGIHVFGSSSMGALRACELEPFGMTGVGKIFEWYRDGKIIADDEVGLLYDPESGAALSDPMVNMRATFAKAKECGKITDAEEKTLLKTCKSIYYPERT